MGMCGREYGASAYLTRLNGGTVEQALFAGAFSYIGSEVNFETGNWAGNALVRGAFAGDIAAVQGGNFWRGFAFAAAGSLAESAYQGYTNGATPDLGPGQNGSQYIERGQPGSSVYDAVDGYVPKDWWTRNLFGNDEATGACFAQSGACSSFADKIPGANALALLHDNWMWKVPSSFNFPLMLPAVFLTYGAFAGEYAVPLLNLRPH